jgi:hypothetical protein
MKRIAAIAALAVAGIFALAYVVLGGFAGVDISRQTMPGYLLAGKFYAGNARDEQLISLFTQVKEYNQEGILSGTLTAVYYDTTDQDKGAVRAFIGVIVADTLENLPGDFTYQLIPERAAVRAAIQSHYLVAPAPERVREKMQNFAQAEGLLLDNFMIEQYRNERDIIIEIPVKTH